MIIITLVIVAYQHSTQKKSKKRAYTVDHINTATFRKHKANTLHNYKENLRIATGSEQCQNRAKKRFKKDCQPCSSRFKGVSKSLRTKKDGTETVRWCVDFRFGQHSERPIFKTEREAAIAYNTLCKKYCPEFCVLNDVPPPDLTSVTDNSSDGDDNDELSLEDMQPTE